MDWRKGSICLPELMSKFYNRGPALEYTDIIFNLPDGGQVAAHKFILAIASPFFEAQFYGVMATEHKGAMEILQGVDSKNFRRIIDFIYNCKALDWNMERMEYWELLEAANLYLIPGLIEHCENKIGDFIKNPVNDEEAVITINKATQLGYSENIYKTGLIAMKNDLATIIKQDSWGKLNLDIVLDIMDDVNLNVKEGELFSAMIKWCKANTNSEEESKELFQEKFVDKVIVQNISHDCFHHFIEPSNYLSSDTFDNWKLQVIRNRIEIGTRQVLIPLRMIKITIEGKDLLNPPKDSGGYSTLQLGALEFTNVHVKWGLLISKDKKQVLLNTSHYPKPGYTKNAIVERVTVKIVAKKEDGSIVTEIDKMVEDKEFTGTFERRRGINRQFVLSTTPDERLEWDRVECVVAIDRRPKCTIRAISEADYCESVCTSPSNAYIDQAKPVEFNANISIAEAMRNITSGQSGHVCNHHSLAETHGKYTQWLYTKKGFLSNLESWNRSSKVNNDGEIEDWTPENMGDFMRLTAHQDSASKCNTWVTAKDTTESEQKYQMISNIRSLISDSEVSESGVSESDVSESNILESDVVNMDKKTLFVCAYNPQNQKIKFLRTISVSVKTEKNTSGLRKSVDLGAINANDEFLDRVCIGDKPLKIFIRRVFPDEDESDPEVQKLLTSEIIKGQPVTQVDNCHVIVLQENAPGIDYDQFLLKKIREINIVFAPRDNEGASFDATLDSESSVTDVIEDLSRLSNLPGPNIRIFECYNGKNVAQRSAEFPIELSSEVKLGEMFDHCKENTKTLFYEANLDSPICTDSRRIAKTSEDLNELAKNLRSSQRFKQTLKDGSKSEIYTSSRRITKTSTDLHKLAQNRRSSQRFKQTQKDGAKYQISTSSRRITKTSEDFNALAQNLRSSQRFKQTQKDGSKYQIRTSSRRIAKTPIDSPKLAQNRRSQTQKDGPKSKICIGSGKITKTTANLHKIVPNRINRFKQTRKDWAKKLRQINVNPRTRGQIHATSRQTRTSARRFSQSRGK